MFPLRFVTDHYDCESEDPKFGSGDVVYASTMAKILRNYADALENCDQRLQLESMTFELVTDTASTKYEFNAEREREYTERIHREEQAWADEQEAIVYARLPY